MGFLDYFQSGKKDKPVDLRGEVKPMTPDESKEAQDSIDAEDYSNAAADQENAKEEKDSPGDGLGMDLRPDELGMDLRPDEPVTKPSPAASSRLASVVDKASKGDPDVSEAFQPMVSAEPQSPQDKLEAEKAALRALPNRAGYVSATPPSPAVDVKAYLAKKLMAAKGGDNAQVEEISPSTTSAPKNPLVTDADFDNARAKFNAHMDPSQKAIQDKLYPPEKTDAEFDAQREAYNAQMNPSQKAIQDKLYPPSPTELAARAQATRGAPFGHAMPSNDMWSVNTVPVRGATSSYQPLTGIPQDDPVDPAAAPDAPPVPPQANPALAKAGSFPGAPASAVAQAPAGGPSATPAGMAASAAMGAQPPQNAPQSAPPPQGAPGGNAPPAQPPNEVQQLAALQAQAQHNARTAGFGNLMDNFARAMTPGLQGTKSEIGTGDYQQPVKDFQARGELQKKNDLQDPSSAVSKRAQMVIHSMHPDWPASQIQQVAAADFDNILKTGQLMSRDKELTNQRNTQAAAEKAAEQKARWEHDDRLAAIGAKGQKPDKTAQDTLVEINKTSALVNRYRQLLKDPKASLQDLRNAHDELLVQLPNLSKRVVRNAGAWQAVAGQVPDPGHPGADMLSSITSKVGVPLTDPLAKLDMMDKLLADDAAAVGGAPSQAPSQGQDQGSSVRASAPPAPGRIRVSNGKETLEIDASGEADAAKEHYLRVR